MAQLRWSDNKANNVRRQSFIVGAGIQQIIPEYISAIPAVPTKSRNTRSNYVARWSDNKSRNVRRWNFMSRGQDITLGYISGIEDAPQPPVTVQCPTIFRNLSCSSADVTICLNTIEALSLSLKKDISCSGCDAEILSAGLTQSGDSVKVSDATIDNDNDRIIITLEAESLGETELTALVSMSDNRNLIGKVKIIVI